MRCSNTAAPEFRRARRSLLGAGLALLAVGFFMAGSAQAGDSTGKDEGKLSSLCDLFDLATFYKGQEGSLIQSLATAGRLQADAVFYREAPGREFDALLWRRVYDGFEAKFRGGFTLHGEVEFDLNQRAPLYQRITEAYLDWKSCDAFAIRIGKQSAPFTLDGKTSSRMLLVPERGLVANNLWFPDNFYAGVTANGKIEGWNYNAGYFSSSGGKEFGDFDAGFFGLLSIGRDFAKQTGLSKAYLAVDYVHNGRDRNNFGTRDLSNVVSLNGKFEQGKFGIWTDLSFGDGYYKQSDLFGFVLTPFYNLTDKLQLVASYNHVASDRVNGVRLDRYENSVETGRSNSGHEFFTGVNSYICGHKLKWQNGVEYTTARDEARDGGQYNGWGYTSAFRMYW